MDIGGVILQDRGMKAEYIKCVLGIVVLSVVVGCAPRIPDPPAETVSLESLLSRLTNVTAMAEQPLGRSYLESSYDRTGGNQDWAVWDRAEADGRITLLDVEGPGYISRIWCTNLRRIEEWAFFFDDEEEPRISMSHDEIFNEDNFPFLEPLVGETSGGRYSLMPIPFSESLRIAVRLSELDPSRRNYFHINYTKLYDEHEMVESWPRTLSQSQSNAVARVLENWKQSSNVLADLAEESLHEAEVMELAPGESVSLFDLSGAGRIDALALEILDPQGGEFLQEEILRNLRMRMWWDGARRPSVDVPVGDFFCNPLYHRHYTSYFMGLIDGQYVTRLPMPFRRGARGQIINMGDVPVRLRSGFQQSDDPGHGRLFHANWAASTTSGKPFRMLQTNGTGHYVGLMLTAIGQDGSWNILEGDEVIWPDPDTQPYQHGTGLEDYFNGAYYYTSLFDHPHAGLIEKGAMRTDQYRWHNLEAVDFHNKLDVTIEFGHGNLSQGYKSSVAYWYADRPHNVTISGGQGQEQLLPRPADRFELAGFMSQLFMLERAGLYAEAADRCDFMAARHAQEPWSDIFALRAAAYREKLKGFESVKSICEQLTRSAFPPVAQQARDLLWFHEDPSHALLGMHIRGEYKLWLNGQKLAEDTSHAVLQVRRLTLEPGTYTWEVETTPNMQGSMVSLYLRTHAGDISSAGDWEVVDLDPLPGRDPPARFRGFHVLPNMTVWQFEPNAYVGMQSGAQGIRTWAFWDGRPLVQSVRLSQSWAFDPDATVPSVSTIDPEDRTEEEERAHAVD